MRKCIYSHLFPLNAADRRTVNNIFLSGFIAIEDSNEQTSDHR